jgi:hypothetical protein
MTKLDEVEKLTSMVLDHTKSRGAHPNQAMTAASAS